MALRRLRWAPTTYGVPEGRVPLSTTFLHPRANFKESVKARLSPKGEAMLNAEQLRDAPLNAQIEF